MITVEDLVTGAFRDKDYRCMNPTCSLYKFFRSGKTLPPFAFFEFCGECRKTLGIVPDEERDNIDRIWMKAIKDAGNRLVFPREVLDYIERKTVEIPVPDTSETGGIG